MKTKEKRLEDLEKRKSPEKFCVVKEVLDCLSLTGEKLYKFEDEEKLLTLTEAEARFSGCTLIIVNYVEKLKSKVYMKDGDQ